MNDLRTMDKNNMLGHLASEERIDLSFTDINYAVKSRNQEENVTILHNLSGKCRSGQLFALMGPSGSGKTSLMNILAGFKVSDVSGTVLVNNRPRNMKTFRPLRSYIMQDDAIIPYLTPLEGLKFCSALRLERDMDRKSKMSSINNLIESLGLTHCQNTLAGNLSGGEKKRFVVSLELVSEPSVIFLDEPTSGLDSSTCVQLVNLFKSLAVQGRTVICTIHQPSARVLEAFDFVYLLGNGRCCFQGEPREMVPFFGAHGLQCPPFHNVADFAIEVLSGHFGDFIDKLASTYEISLSAAKGDGDRSDDMKNGKEKNVADCVEEIRMSHSVVDEDTDVFDPSAALMMVKRRANSAADEIRIRRRLSVLKQKRYANPSWWQFFILICREFICIVRNPILLHIRLLSFIGSGLVLGFLAYDIGDDAASVHSNASVLFFTVILQLLCSLMPSVLSFPLDMPMLVREYNNSWYSLKAYYFAKMAADVPFQFLFPVLYIVPFYYLSGQPMEIQRMTLFYLTILSVSVISHGLAMLVGAVLPAQPAVYAAAVCSVPNILFNGAIVMFSEMPVFFRYLTYIFYGRYIYENFIQAIYGFDRKNMKCSKEFCQFKNPQKFLEFLEVDDANVGLNFLALSIYMTVVLTAGYVCLRRRVNSLK